MEDFNFWWYIIAAVIYFLTRGKKKKNAGKPPAETTSGAPNNAPKSFEELLKEITEGRNAEKEEEQRKPIVEEQVAKEEKEIRLEGRRRVFADDESRKVYEESIKMAEGADLSFERDDKFKAPSSLKKEASTTVKSYAEELMDGFDTDEARKAVIYSEIFNRRY